MGNHLLNATFGSTEQCIRTIESLDAELYRLRQENGQLWKFIIQTGHYQTFLDNLEVDDAQRRIVQEYDNEHALELDSLLEESLARPDCAANALELETFIENANVRASMESNSDDNIDSSLAPFNCTQPSLTSSPQSEHTVWDEVEPEADNYGKGRNVSVSVVNPEDREQLERAQRLREIAQNAQIRIDEEQRKKRIYRQHGNHEDVSKCSDRIKTLREFQKACNDQAGKILFTILNPHYYRPSMGNSYSTTWHHSTPAQNLDVIDLHHLSVKEAICFAKEHIALCRIEKVQSTVLICGQGKHSEGGISRLKPALQEALSLIPGLKINEYEWNLGRLVVHILDDDLLSSVIRVIAPEPAIVAMRRMVVDNGRQDNSDA